MDLQQRHPLAIHWINHCWSSYLDVICLTINILSLCYHVDCNSCDDDDDDGHLPANTDHWNWIEIGFCNQTHSRIALRCILIMKRSWIKLESWDSPIFLTSEFQPLTSTCLMPAIYQLSNYLWCFRMFSKEEYTERFKETNHYITKYAYNKCRWW